MKSTGNRMRASFNDMPAVSLSNLVLEFKDYEEISQIQNGLLVTDDLGAHTAIPISGRFSVEYMKGLHESSLRVVVTRLSVQLDMTG